MFVDVTDKSNTIIRGWLGWLLNADDLLEEIKGIKKKNKEQQALTKMD